MANTHTTSKKMNIIVWIAQVILAAGFIWAASMKLFQPADKLAAMWPWTAAHRGLVKFTGILDLLAGIGLVLPALLRIQPKLTIYAAYGIVALMIAGSIFHISRGESSVIGVNIFFAIVAVFVAWARQKKVPITSK
jgi:uncharacterized membrane protein YphA (DoxX/SURF4 family)